MNVKGTDIIYTTPTAFWALLAISGLLIGFAFFDTSVNMISKWNNSEEYGYGYLIPIITVLLIFQRKNILSGLKFQTSVLGMFIVLLGGGLMFLGAAATTHTLSQYGLVITIMGVALSLLGWRAFKVIAIPLALLFFMVPLPPFIYNNLSTKLQLISSEIGVAGQEPP